MNLSDTSSLATIASFLAAVIAGVFGLWRHIERRQNDFELHQVRIADKLDAIVVQFGPNGGGLRQAVNEMSHKIDKIEERQIAIGDKVAQLQGEFNQHVIEN
jgi:hypothetical protein